MLATLLLCLSAQVSDPELAATGSLEHAYGAVFIVSGAVDLTYGVGLIAAGGAVNDADAGNALQRVGVVAALVGGVFLATGVLIARAGTADMLEGLRPRGHAAEPPTFPWVTLTSTTVRTSTASGPWNRPSSRVPARPRD